MGYFFVTVQQVASLSKVKIFIFQTRVIYFAI